MHWFCTHKQQMLPPEHSSLSLQLATQPSTSSLQNSYWASSLKHSKFETSDVHYACIDGMQVLAGVHDVYFVSSQLNMLPLEHTLQLNHILLTTTMVLDRHSHCWSSVYALDNWSAKHSIQRRSIPTQTLDLRTHIKDTAVRATSYHPP